MKTLITSILMVCYLPFVLCAQPTILTNEFYHIGDVISMVNASAASVNPGPPGENLVWNFSTIAASGGLSVTTVVHDTSSVYPTANIMITLPNGQVEHMQENSSDSYILAMIDNAKGITYNYNNFDISKRPFTYHSFYLDTYKTVITIPATVGTGYISATGDAYGTLILPGGTYGNVLRIRRQKTETDTSGGSVSNVINVTTYLWFDTSHTAPLLRIDSVSGIGGSSTDAMYLPGTTGFPNLNSAQSNQGHTAFISNNTLFVSGNFEPDKIYQVAMYNIIGSELFRQDFTGYGNSSKGFDTQREIRPGIYIVSISVKNSPDSREVIKVVKQ